MSFAAGSLARPESSSAGLARRLSVFVHPRGRAYRDGLDSLRGASHCQLHVYVVWGAPLVTMRSVVTTHLTIVLASTLFLGAPGAVILRWLCALMLLVAASSALTYDGLYAGVAV